MLNNLLKHSNRYMTVSLIAIFTTLSSNAIAGGFFTGDGVVSELNSEGNIVVVKVIASDLAYHDSCDATGEAILVDDTKNGDRQFSLLLAAQVSGNKVSIYTSGCFAAWGQNYPKISAVRIRQQ